MVFFSLSRQMPQEISVRPQPFPNRLLPAIFPSKVLKNWQRTKQRLQAKCEFHYKWRSIAHCGVFSPKFNSQSFVYQFYFDNV
jgi:hypothetical protein